MDDDRLKCDVALFGGGAMGLWMLDELRRRGSRAVLIETGRLGDGQTSAAQGILHGGTRYALKGLISSAARAVSAMPGRWRTHLEGGLEPDLSAVRMRAAFCHLWRNDSWTSWLGMQGARLALHVQPEILSDELRPDPLTACPGCVYRLDEPVIDTISLLEVLRERNIERLLRVEGPAEISLGGLPREGSIDVELARPAGGAPLKIAAQRVVLAAGRGNEALREQFGLPAGAMQRRPLHVPVLKGDLPALNGHCVDGAHTRVTVTTQETSNGKRVWQLGGQVSEDGVRMESAELIAHARRELAAVLPEWARPRCVWSTFRVDRAELRTPDRARPDDVNLLREGGILTVWPTKLVLVPLAVERALTELGVDARPVDREFVEHLRQTNWPAPEVARYPWDQELTWHHDA